MLVKVDKIIENSDGTATLTIELDEETEEIIKKFYNTINLTQEMIENFIKQSLVMTLDREQQQK